MKGARRRLASILVLATCALALAAGVVESVLAASTHARHPSVAVRRSMVRAVQQRLCFRQNAWLSGSDRHYGLIITQVACGGSYYNHWWLFRRSLSAAATWTVVDERVGKIDRRASCSTAKHIPADIRCK